MSDNNVQEKNGIGVYFSPKVKPGIRKFVTNNLQKVMDKSDKNKDFFNSMRIGVYENWSDSKNLKNSVSEKINGLTTYPIFRDNNSFNIKTNLDLIERRKTIFKEKADRQILKEIMLHEMGHLFDYYFANPDEKLVARLEEFILSEDFSWTEEFCELFDIYLKQNGLSDSDIFKEAWKKDVEAAFKGRTVTKNERKCLKLGAYSPVCKDKRVVPEPEAKEIILEDGIDERELVAADRAREELFAELFSFAMGGKESLRKKRLITKTYKNSYKAVKEFINEYLGINCNNKINLRARKKIDYES